MSIGIGIICRDGIVMAADSLIADRSAGTPESVDKIRAINFGPGNRVLAIQAGSWGFTNRALDKFQSRADTARALSPQAVQQMIEDSIRDAKSPLDEEQKQCVENSQIIYAFYCDKTPYLYSVEMNGDGISEPQSTSFKSIGVAAFLSHYLLFEHLPPYPPIDLAIAIAIYAIKKAKDYSIYCGLETRIKLMTPIFVGASDCQYVARWIPIDREIIDLAEKELVEVDKRTKSDRNKQFFEAVTEVANTVHTEREKKSNLPVDNPK